MPDFAEYCPEKFTNKTNGITPRRWLVRANPRLSNLITARVGETWPTDARRHAVCSSRGRMTKRPRTSSWRSSARARKRWRGVVKSATSISIDPDWLFDIHAKRIHEYKRQLLNALHVLDLYWRIKGGERPVAPRVHLFAGKAAPGYVRAKLIIKLINAIAEVVNADPDTRRWLRVVFVPDYRVTLAETIVTAADLSEQISTAGTEASGTGNMKFALNGALTIGTLDGANIEIAQAVGAENLFMFGLKVDEVQRQMADRSYRPLRLYEEDARVRQVVDSLDSGILAPEEPGVFHPIRDTLLGDNEHYFHLADLVTYREAQQQAAMLWTERRAWARKALLTVARMSRFSSDRTVREYAEEIWQIKPVV